MELQVYWSEYFSKWIWWYVIFFGIVTVVFVLAIYLGRYQSIWDYLALLLSALVIAGYFYFNKKNQIPIKMKVSDSWLIVGSRSLSWLSIQGYVLEMDKNTSRIKNIVILFTKGHQIHTIVDKSENLENFVEDLNRFKPRFDEYEQTFFERLARVCRL